MRQRSPSFLETWLHVYERHVQLKWINDVLVNAGICNVHNRQLAILMYSADLSQFSIAVNVVMANMLQGPIFHSYFVVLLDTC